jgi:hypothetical protein
MAYASERKGPISPGFLAWSDVSHLSALTLVSQDSSTTVVSAHDVSNYKRTSYYNRITDNSKHLDLLYRTRSAKHPWIQPTGRHAHPPPKSLRGVHSTPLNGVWSTVGPLVCDLVKSAVKTRYSIDPSRFITHREDGEDTLGPVVIWVAVYPGSTSADTAHKVSLVTGEGRETPEYPTGEDNRNGSSKKCSMLKDENDSVEEAVGEGTG